MDFFEDATVSSSSGRVIRVEAAEFSCTLDFYAISYFVLICNEGAAIYYYAGALFRSEKSGSGRLLPLSL